MAPEVIGKNYDKKADSWSAGVVLYCMLAGRPPFNDDDQVELMVKIT